LTVDKLSKGAERSLLRFELDSNRIGRSSLTEVNELSGKKESQVIDVPATNAWNSHASHDPVALDAARFLETMTIGEAVPAINSALEVQYRVAGLVVKVACWLVTIEEVML
jgi:hypothetical protein